MSLVVVISRHTDTISNGDQCFSLIRYFKSFSEVSELRQRHGWNKLESEEKEHIVIRFLSTFKDPLILMLLGSCALSIIVGQVSLFVF